MTNKPSTLLVGGCSHTWGQGLISPDPAHSPQHTQRESLTWPWLVNADLELDQVHSLASPGTGLEHLVRRLRQCLMDFKDHWDLGRSMIILQLPEPSRWEIAEPRQSQDPYWKTFTSGDVDVKIKFTTSMVDTYRKLRLYYDSLDPETLIMKELTHIEALTQLARHYGVGSVLMWQYQHRWLYWPAALRQHAEQIVDFLDSDHLQDPWKISQVGHQWDHRQWDHHPDREGHREIAARICRRIKDISASRVSRQ